MLDHGADGVSFETIVATGANSAIPHHRPDGRGPDRGRFRQDRLRRAGVRIPLRHDADLRARADRPVAARDLRPGDRRPAGRPRSAGARGGAARCRRRIAAGHQSTPGTPRTSATASVTGSGLQIHEAPGINATAAGTLLAGSAVTVEPGVYLPDRGGVRIEDTLMVDRGPRPRITHPVPQRAGDSLEARSTTDVASTADFKNGLVLQHRRPAVADHRVPARQARQGSGLRADEAEERAVGQGRRQDLQRRGEGGDRHRGPSRRHLPVPRRHRLRVHGLRGLRAAPAVGGVGRSTPPASCSRACRCRSPSTTARRCTSSFR